MKMSIRILLTAMGLAAVSAAATPGAASPPAAPVTAARVARLVEDTTLDSISQSRAIDALVDMGRAAVPYLVPHLGDGRPLAERSIILPSRPWRIHTRQFQPWTVHDAMVVVLREVEPQGPGIGSTNPHTTDPGQRALVKRKWVAWCVGHYPAQADDCRR